MSAETLKPQAPSTARVSIESPNWAFEPFWPGQRFLSTVNDESVGLTDPDGADVADAFPEAVAALRDAVLTDAVVDGIWTAQPFLGAASAQRWAATMGGTDGDEPPTIDPAFLETRRAFVAVDLLSLDETSLLDVPYQERRRLLASVIREDGHVRVTPAVKVPVNSWFHAWRANGFDRAIAKQVNSHYIPGRINPDWVVVPLQAELPRGATRLLWKPRKPKQVVD